MEEYKLTIDDKEWLNRAIEKELTRLQVKKKLQEVKYEKNKINSFLQYFDEEMMKIRENEEIQQNNERDIEDEIEFKEDVKSYFGKGDKKLTFIEKWKVKNFLKNVDKYAKMMNIATIGFKREIEEMNKNGWDKGKIEEELEYLKEEMIDRIIDSKTILEIEHPITHEEVTKENLKDLEINLLIKLMEDNIETLNMVVNGKIPEENTNGN